MVVSWICPALSADFQYIAFRRRTSINLPCREAIRLANDNSSSGSRY